MSRHRALAPLLHDMLATARAPDRAMLAALSDADWERIAAMAKQHRMAPLLHHRIEERGGDWPVPAALRARWARGWRAAAERSLAVQQALIAVTAIADRAGLPYAALKGAWLAWHAYPHPALRPMRDVDLLLEEEDAVRLNALMIEAGAAPGKFSHTPVAFARAHHKHLAPLHWGPHKVAFEIHWRLSNPQEGEDRADVAATTAALLARRMRAKAGPAEIACLDPTDTLLHLVVHAVYGRQPFDTGPQTLSDVALAIDTAAIDWPRFWAAAAGQGRGSGARLLFALVGKYMGVRETCDPDPAPVPERLIAAAEALMLQDMDARAERGFATQIAEAGGRRGKAAFAWTRAFPPKHIVAHYAGVPADSWRVWPAYPVRMAGHGWRWLFRRGDPARDAEVADARAMRAWLAGRAVEHQP